MQLTAKFSFVSLLASLLSASALKLNVPVPVPGDVELQTNGKALVTWTLEEGDPEIMSINIQNNFRFFAFVNNVPTAPGNVTGVLTDIPGGDTYFMQAFKLNDVLDVVGTSGVFSVVGPFEPPSA